MTSDPHGKGQELVENDKIFEKVISDFFYIPPFWNGSRQFSFFFFFCMDLMLNEKEDSKAKFDVPFMGRGGLEQK